MSAKNNHKDQPFRRIHSNGGQAPKPEADEFSKVLSDLDQQEESLSSKLQELTQKRQQANEAIRQEKLEKLNGLRSDAVDWREMADKFRSEPEVARDYLNLAKSAEAEAAELAADLGIAEKAPEAAGQTARKPALSTTRAIWYTIGMFLLSALATYYFGSKVAADPNNAMGHSMFQNAPVRALLSFTLTFLTVLVGVLFIRLFFPQLYRIWHNRVESERTFESVLSEAPAWAVLGSILLLVWLFTQLFASFYQALYA
ncbi:hypothetical protein [Arsenicibacter rosenii]|nr:hypothetical protein [Arsenicibacter rosenii]